MARETRGSAAAAHPVSSDIVDGPSAPKRKRQSSTSVNTDGPRPISLKVTLPVSGQEGTSNQKLKLNVSPTKGEPEQGVKRQRINLKVKGGGKKNKVEDGANGMDLEGQDNVGQEGDESKVDEGDVEEEDDKVGIQKGVVRALDREVRDALAVVISQMATNLPKPVNQVLTLFLPPSFEQKEENTLLYILKQDDLSWERLVDLLHVFCSHLLQRSAYPCPFPPLSHIHTSIPPLQPHQPSHGIYDFCSALRDLILSVEPSPTAPKCAVEKWGLLMRVPGGTEGRGAGEWWTSIADWRETRKIKIEGKEEGSGEGVLEKLAYDGDKFGYANPVSITSFTGFSTGNANAPKLGDSLVRKASLKALKWKEQLSKRKGGFGSFYRPVTIPRTSTLPWTPTFAATFDSSSAAGGIGYWKTLEAMHQRNRYASWDEGISQVVADEEVKEGYWGTLGSVGKGGPADQLLGEGDAMDPDVVGVPGSGEEKEVKVKDARNGVDDKLRDNAQWLNELLGWQEIRTRKGITDLGERESMLADELLHSLSTLSSTVPPSALLPAVLEPGFASSVSSRLIHTPGPIIRGTLDPRRPKAIHDNTTIRPRPATSHVPIPNPAHVPGPPSIAQQLAGTPSRPLNTGNGYTPTPSSSSSNYNYSSNQTQSQLSHRTSYGYSPNPQPTSNNIPPPPSRSSYIPTSQLLGQSSSQSSYSQTPAASSRPTYTHSHYLPGQLGPASGNTIYSNGRSQGINQNQQVMMGNSGSPSPGLNQPHYARPGMPSGLRQSFGPGSDVSPATNNGFSQNGGYFSGGGRNA